MALSVQDVLADKGVHPPQEHLVRLESKWAEIQQRRADLDGVALDGVALDDADIAVRNIPGGDHVR